MKPIYPMNVLENQALQIWPNGRVTSWELDMKRTQSWLIDSFEMDYFYGQKEGRRVEADYEVFGNNHIGLVITGKNPGEINNIATLISQVARSKDTWPLPLRGPVVLMRVETWEALEDNESE